MQMTNHSFAGNDRNKLVILNMCIVTGSNYLTESLLILCNLWCVRKWVMEDLCCNTICVLWIAIYGMYCRISFPYCTLMIRQQCHLLQDLMWRYTCLIRRIFFVTLARSRYMREAVRKLNGRCVGIRCAIGWLRECRYDNAIIFRAHRNCIGDSNLIIYDTKVHSVLGERIVMVLYCCPLQVTLKYGLCYGHSRRTVHLLWLLRWCGKRTTQNVRYLLQFL